MLAAVAGGAARQAGAVESVENQAFAGAAAQVASGGLATTESSYFVKV